MTHGRALTYKSDGALVTMASNLLTMAPNLVAMASNLLAQNAAEILVLRAWRRRLEHYNRSSRRESAH